MSAGRAALVGVMAALACAPVETVREEPARPSVEQATAGRELPAELRAVVPAWQRVDPAWLVAASVWVVGTYFQAAYPCRPGPDGSLDMIQQDAFTPTRVLRGALRIREVDVDAWRLKGPGFPASLVEGRSYLLLLRPSPEVARKLADPEGLLGMDERLGSDQVVAIVDLSQSAEEARDDAVPASRSGTRDGVRFDPAAWAAARGASEVTAAQHGPIAGFVAAELLRAPGATVAGVRAWLGEPDEQQRRDPSLLLRYWLARERYATPVDGAIYGQVELRFARGRLLKGSVTYFRWRFAPGERSSSEISDAELQRLGLRVYRLEPVR